MSYQQAQSRHESATPQPTTHASSHAPKHHASALNALIARCCSAHGTAMECAMQARTCMQDLVARSQDAARTRTHARGNQVDGSHDGGNAPLPHKCTASLTAANGVAGAHRRLWGPQPTCARGCGARLLQQHSSYESKLAQGLQHRQVHWWPARPLQHPGCLPHTPTTHLQMQARACSFLAAAQCPEDLLQPLACLDGDLVGAPACAQCVRVRVGISGACVESFQRQSGDTLGTDTNTGARAPSK